MKHVKKFLTLALVMLLTLSFATTAFAAGETGSITIKSAENVSVAGKTFNAYKILDLELVGDGYVYTVPEELVDFYEDYFWTNDDGTPTTVDESETLPDFDYEVAQKIAEMEDNSAELFNFATDALNKAKEEVTDENNKTVTLITPATVTGADGATSVTFEDLPLGYYVIEDTGAATPISALMLDSTNPNPEITIKADKPELEKKIDGEKDTDDTTKGLVDYNNAAIGDVVPYVLTSKVPDMTGYTKYFYVVTDTLSAGLTFNNGVKIQIGEDDLVGHIHEEECYETVLSCENTEHTDETHEEVCYKTQLIHKKVLICENMEHTAETHEDTCYETQVTCVEENSCDYTVAVTTNADGSTTVEIVFVNFIQYKDQAGAEIKITYSTTVDEDAVIGVEGNPNEVKLDYSNNPNEESNGTPENPDKPDDKDPTGKTPEDITYTYVTDLIIIKVDPNGNRLEGAEFTLTGDKLNKIIVEKEVFTEDANGTYWKLTDGTFTTDDPTTEGMDQTKYESTTVKYTKETVTEVVTTSETVTATATVGSDGVVKFEGLSAGTYTITEIKAPDGYNLLDEPLTVTITWTAPKEGSTECTWTYSDPAVGNTVTIVNQAGTELPETGGIGTTMFYIIGSILVLTSVVVLVTKKRMGNAE